MTRWSDTTARFDGLDPQRTTARDTAWQFTAHAGDRAHSVYLLVRNSVLRMFDLPPGEPPPWSLIPHLQAYVAQLLRHPDMERRAPRSLDGVELAVVFKQQWVEITGAAGP